MYKMKQMICASLFYEYIRYLTNRKEHVNSHNNFFMIELFFYVYAKSMNMSDYGIKIGHGVHTST